jgi:hypothetical protein
LPDKQSQTNNKNHPWPEKAPNGIHAAAIDGRFKSRGSGEVVEIAAQTPSAAQKLFSPSTYLRWE